VKNSSTVKLLDIESFSDTFGGASKRKRPNLRGSGSLAAMLENAEKL